MCSGHSHCNPYCNPVERGGVACSDSRSLRECRTVVHDVRADDRCAGRSPSHCAAAPRPEPTLNLSGGGGPSINSAQLLPPTPPLPRASACRTQTVTLAPPNASRFAVPFFLLALPILFFKSFNSTIEILIIFGVVEFVSDCLKSK